MKLTVDKINKSYGNHTVLNNVSFTMDNGVYGLLGSNGAGKTTLINIIVRLIGQDSGVITCDDVDVTKLGGEYFNRIGYLPQYPRLYKNFTAVEFLKYMAELKGLKKSKSSKRINELLELVNLSTDKDKKIGAFSGGMRQRLGIAQAMLNDPKLLILDEPTAGLDPRERIRFRNILSALSADRIVLIATHIVSDIEHIAKNVILIGNGNVLCQSTPEKLINEMKGKVYECVVPIEDMQSCMSKYCISNAVLEQDGYHLRIVGENYPENAVPCDTPTLEDAFLMYSGEKIL